MDIGLLAGIAGMALLFGLVGLIPFAHRSCSECGGDCSSCLVEEAEELPGVPPRPSPVAPQTENPS